jgi:pyruvate/2-oxoacid:ferredoxin oxidoreductase alpha subunit
MVCYDGYLLSHAQMPVSVPKQNDVDRFLPLYKPHTILDPANPKNYNLVTLANPRVNAEGVLCHGYMEIRQLLQEALQNSLKIITDTGREFGKIFNRSYENFFWDDGISGADTIMVAMGSLAMEATVAAEMLRKEGYKIGVLGIRVFRPFPKVAIVSALKKAKHIIIFDKNISYGAEGATCSEIKTALYGSGVKAVVKNFIVGLGGRDVKAKELLIAVKQSIRTDASIETYPEWLSQI